MHAVHRRHGVYTNTLRVCAYKLVLRSAASYNRGLTHMWRLALISLIGSLPAFADEAPAIVPVPTALTDIMHARNFGMAGAYRALGYGAESIGGNPAAISLYRRYQIEASGAWDIPNGYGWGGTAVVDSQTSEVAGGASYQLVTFNTPEGRNTAHVSTLALAMGFGSIVHIGLQGRYHLIYGPAATNSITMGAGVIVRPWEWLCLSLSGHNLIPVNSIYIQRYFSLAVSSMIGMFTPTFELRGDFNASVPRFAYSGGIEWIAGGAVPLRAGYVWDGIAGTQYAGAGIGYFSEGSGVDIAYRHEFGGHNGRMVALTIKVQIN